MRCARSSPTRSASARGRPASTMTARRVTLHLAGGERVTGDALIGADGVHSRIRNILAGDDKPEFTGCMAWRGLVPVEKLPAHMRRNVGVNWVGPGGHVINYFLRRGEIFNFVGIVERDWRVESWTERGTREECAADFRRLERRHPCDHPQHRRAVQMGAARPHAADALLARARDPARRCRASDAADAGAGRQHGDRGRHGAGALPRGLSTMPRPRWRATTPRVSSAPRSWCAARTRWRNDSTIRRSRMRRAPRPTSMRNGTKRSSSSATTGSSPMTQRAWRSER